MKNIKNLHLHFFTAIFLRKQENSSKEKKI